VDIHTTEQGHLRGYEDETLAQREDTSGLLGLLNIV
jgi:hypothetical protein